MVNKTHFSLGVVGYSASNFDKDKARVLVETGILYFKRLIESFGYPKDLEIISGLTDLGIPSLAYRYGSFKGLRLVGIACGKAFDYPCFPVSEKIIVGQEWGDESQTFLDRCDAILRVGGGKQSHAEVAAFKKLKPHAEVMELELPLL